jgi:hypothetical protein
VGSKKLDGRVWDVRFNRRNDVESSSDKTIESCAIAVACGDYKTIFFDWSLQPTLQVVRPRTVRCLDYHPKLPLLAMGDGAGCLAIVDYQEEETVKELKVGGRVNVLEFSPAGDFLLVGTDDCTFTLYETTEFKVVQEFRQEGFALSGSFSPSGKYLALGSSSEPYAILRMGSLLGIDLVPLNEHHGKLPDWALKETIFRSGFGPSMIQRHMMRGKQDSLIWVSNSLREYPDAIYTMNRHRNEGCLETALRLRKVRLLQASVKVLVDGSLEKQNGGKRSILTTQLPSVGRRTLMTMLESHPAALIVEILQSLTFVKVPFTKPRIAPSDRRMVSTPFVPSTKLLISLTQTQNIRFVPVETTWIRGPNYELSMILVKTKGKWFESRQFSQFLGLARWHFFLHWLLRPRPLHLIMKRWQLYWKSCGRITSGNTT